MTSSMWKAVSKAGLAGAALLASGGLLAANAVPPAAVAVSRIVPAQPSQAAPEQIGVLVFFDFSPASRALLARLVDWAGEVGRRIVLDREPLVGAGPAPLARAFVVARILGVTDSVLPGIFALAPPRSDAGNGQDTGKMQAAIAGLFKSIGINEIEFSAAWNSPLTEAGLVRARALAARFQATQAPILIVNGTWQLTPGAGTDAGAMLATLNRQVAIAAGRVAANQ